MLETKEEAPLQAAAEEKIPDEYFCPLSGEIMQDPVILLDDQITYQREAIDTYLRTPGSLKSPVKRTRLYEKRYINNDFARDAIRHFLNERPRLRERLQHHDRIKPDLDAYAAALIAHQQDEIAQDKERRSTPFITYLKHVKDYLEKRELLNQHEGANNYDVFISYAWEDQDKKNLESHNKLQAFLERLHDDLQKAGLKVFWDGKDMKENMHDVMEKSVRQSGIILSICKPFLKKTVADRPKGNVALEVNYALERVENEPVALLPLLFEGEWDDALPLQMQGKVRTNEPTYQDVRNVFSSFDRHNQYSPAYMEWFANHLIPRVLSNLGVPVNDLLLASITQLFHSQRQQEEFFQQRPFPRQALPYEQFEHNYPNSSAEKRKSTELQAFEFSLRCLAALTKFHRAKLEAKDAKDEELPEQQVLLVSPSPTADPVLTAWVAQFSGHLTLAGLTVISWSPDRGGFPQQAPHAVIALCTPDFKRTVEGGLDQPGSSWLQLQQHLAQPGINYCPIIYEGSFGTSIPNWSKNCSSWEKKDFLVRNTTDYSLDPSKPYYYELMVGIGKPKGLLHDLLNYEDNDACCNILYNNLQMMLIGWGTKALLDLEISEQAKKAEEQQQAAVMQEAQKAKVEQAEKRAVEATQRPQAKHAEEVKSAEQVEQAKKAQAAEQVNKVKPSVVEAAAERGFFKQAVVSDEKETEQLDLKDLAEIFEITNLLKEDDDKSPVFIAAINRLTGCKELFLLFVVAGKQEQAEKMLKKNPRLAEAKGTVTDLSDRTFENITGFQYALWALDWHMWKMVLKYLPEEKAALQMEELECHGTRHGTYFSFEPLLCALDEYIRNYDKWRNKWLPWGDERKKHWYEQVGEAQLQLPAHVINEYCRTDRSFCPTPSFEDTKDTMEYLPRTMKTNKGGWFTAEHNDGKLGVGFAVLRGDLSKATCKEGHNISTKGMVYAAGAAMSQISVLSSFGITTFLSNGIESDEDNEKKCQKFDYKALKFLSKARLRQLEELKSTLLLKSASPERLECRQQ
ncbi:MAG: hypothetical protein K0Q74_1571 [Gammaproteobacteria bacterium]|nr:hypothetical protein [Gammaproteobacteria bacterium]